MFILSTLIHSCKEGSDEAEKHSQPIKLLETQNVEYAYPHWSKNADSILFQSNKSDLWQIYIMDSKAENIVQVTSDSSNNYFPDWSPDNKKICFVSDRTGNEEIYVMDNNGTNVIQLTNNNARDIHPYWTPDGSKIFFNSTQNDSGNFEIYEILPDGTSLNRITDSKDNETCARLSPYGEKLVYLKNNDEGLDDVFLMDLKNKTEINLTNTPTRDGWPSWMPNGKEILFSALDDDIYKLFIYDLKVKSIKRLTNPKHPYNDGRANISKDGKKIVFNRQVHGPKNTIGIYVLFL